METFLAATLAGMAYAFALSGGSFSALVASQAIVLAAPLVGVAVRRTSLSYTDAGLWLFFSAVLLLTILANMGNYPGDAVGFAFLHAVGVIGMLFVAHWAAANTDIRQVLRGFAILLFPLVAYAVALALMDGDFLLRKAPLELHPNWWGEVAFASCASSFALRSLKWRFVHITAAIVLMLLVQSRGALLAAALVIGLHVALSVRITPPRVVAALLLAVLAFTASLMAPTWTQNAADVVAFSVLLLDDPERGLGTGLTGRLEGFSMAWNAITEHPLLGRGFDTLPEVHNGFLKIAAEGGLLLLALILAMIGAAFTRACRARDVLSIAILLGYVTLTMTYPRMLNMNVASAMFYLCLFRRKHQ